MPRRFLAGLGAAAVLTVPAVGAAASTHEDSRVTGATTQAKPVEVSMRIMRQNRTSFLTDVERARIQRESRTIAEGEERIRRAERLAALVDAGRCEEARAQANRDGDRRMALRVRQTCRSRG